SRETAASKIAENVAERAPANISSGCNSNPSVTAVETLDAAGMPGDPQVVALRVEAQKTRDAGDLAKADTLLLEVEAKRRQAFDKLGMDRADTFALCAKMALIQLKYADAAKHFA